MRRDSFLVQDDGSTPDRPLVKCFYCSAPVGSEHVSGCVMRRRTVVLRATVEFVAEVSEDEEPGFIHFRLNEGTWCKNNLVDMLAAHVGGDEDNHECLCFHAQIEYVREATEADEERSSVRVERFTD